MRVHLGLGTAAKPTLRQLHERLRDRIGLISASEGVLSFLRDHERLLDLPIEVDDGQFIVDVPLPRRGQQLVLVPSRPRSPRGASLREEAEPVDQQLVGEVVSALQASAEAAQAVAELSSTLPAADLAGAIRHLEASTGVDAGALRRDIAKRRDTLRVELPNQTDFLFPVPPAVRKTVVAESPVALFLQPPACRHAIDLVATVLRKLCIYEAPVHPDPGERRPADRFELERSYEFRLVGFTPAQHAVIAAAWALGYDVGVLARYATSTSTLKAAPAEVDEVIGWTQLVRAVAASILDAAASPYRTVGTYLSDPESTR
jgi:hypothetical protein